ncbi:DUF4270 family protein [Parabacteroides provencensis]|uniref:DUF4270 family protein n=1 Tax=Parabacteroides provencensis TaxID=1944636 RepID=UPI000C14D70A|nr:DUF4270 family protein [Parabacteroides provencensis]
MYRQSLFFIPLLFLLGVSSCYDDANTFGSGLVESSFRNVVIDTCTVNITSVLIDSLETSGKEVALIGQYTHPFWGTVSSSSFIAYKHPSYETDIAESVVLDSLMLSLSYNGHFIGDTALVQRFSIHKLTEKIVLNDNDYLYNNSSVQYDTDPLAVVAFKPKPGSGDRLEVRLSDAIGQDLLTRLHNRDDLVSDDRFEDYFKGIVIIPEKTESQSLLSFNVSDSSALLNLHYHVIGEVGTERTLSIQPNTDTQFNHIDHDRTGTLLEGYPSKQVEISSSLLDDKGFLFCGLGWYTRLEFPFLNNIMQHGEQVHIDQALLKIYPDPSTYSDFNPLPDSIYLYIADENNVVTDAVKDYLGSEVQSGVLERNDADKGNTYYYFDVSDFMQEELGTIGMYKHNLQFVFSSDDYTGTFRNLTFSDQNGRSPIVLQLTYKIYESY